MVEDGVPGRARAWLARSAIAVLLLAIAPGSAHAQVQRSFANLGFELPVWGAGACHVQVPVTLVPGWQTTHPAMLSNGTCPNLPSPPETGPLVEIWRSGQGNVVAQQGSQFAELNAATSSRIYQNVCMANGEQVRWSFLHRGRQSETTSDVAEFNINSDANTVYIARTRNTGVSESTAADCPVSDGGVTAGSCSAPVQVGTWSRYAGTFTWNGPSGTQNVGFAAISTAGDVLSIGNLIDDIRFTLVPYVEFAQPTYTLRESELAAGVVKVQIRLVGVVPAAGITIPMIATGGTASPGTDYLLGDVFIPGGSYSDSEVFDVPLTLVDDAIIEDNETVVLSMGASPGNYTVASTVTCGAPAVASSTVTIIDDDVDLAVAKNVSSATPAAGAAFTYTVVYSNNTAAPTRAPLAAHDVTASIIDVAPAGVVFDSWTCSASGGASCPVAAGSGDINLSALLPAGNGAAGGALTFLVSARATGAPHCGVLTNTATIAAAAGPPAFTEGVGVQAGFASPAPGGTANNTATADVDPACPARLQLDKVTAYTAGGPFAFDLTNTTLASASVSTSAANTAQQVDGDDTAPGVQPFASSMLGADITIEESALPAGWSLAGAACTANGVAVGARTGNRYVIPGASVVEDADIRCTFNNTRAAADLSIRKTNTPADGPDDLPGDGVVSGATTVYRLQIGNAGPDAADGAVVRDVPGAGLGACTVTCPAAMLVGGASCPANPGDALTAGGATIPLLPAGGQVTLQVSCQVQ